MPILARILVAVLALMIAGPAAAQKATFSHQGVSRDAQRYETWIRLNLKPGQAKAKDLKAAADTLLASDPRGAARSYGMAAVADPDDAQAWLGIARALMAIPVAGLSGSERYEVPMNASAAALRAYERARTVQFKAVALASLGEALKRRSFWRPAIDALQASLALAEAPDVRSAYEALRDEHGFRLIDYKTEVEAAEPRLCLQFSEKLARGQTDIAKFVSVDGRDPQSISVEGNQLCVEGLTHGKRYELQVRAGLPAEIGETLLKPTEITAYVKDRASSVRFTGRSYVLPSRGQQGIPVVTVNTDKVDVEIYRIGDRTLASTLVSGDLQKQLTGYDLETIKDRTGARVFKGELDVAKRINEEVTTALPIGEAVPELKPGVYAMVARAAGSTDEQYADRATQWFIVSDLGLTALTGDDGIHAFVRSLASADAVSNASVRLVARNSEVLGQGKTDASGHVRFEPGLKRGEGGMAPAILVAEGPSGDYAFLDLTTAAFDLSDRGVKGREQPGPIDGYLYSDRGVYRPGETVQLTALVRDAAAKASTVPMTLIIVRPDGVEHRRIALADQGLGGRAAAIELSPSAMTGTWRARLHSDPKTDAVASLSFLVEDFVPERMDLKLEPAVKALAPEDTGTIKVSGRYLYGPPAANLALEGDIVVKASNKDIDGLPGYRFGRTEEKITTIRKPLENLPATSADGHADLAIVLPAIPRTDRPLEAEVIVRMREPGGRTIERNVTLPVDPQTARVGVKPLFKNDEVGEGDVAEFDVVLVGADGRPDAGGLKWELLRLDQSWQWYSRDGQWAYESSTLSRRVNGGSVQATGGQPARIVVKPEQWGRFRLEVSTADSGGPLTSVTFRSGWYASDAPDSPEALEVALDKPVYKPGETAKLKIASKQGGKALIAVLGGGVGMTRQVDIPKGGGEVPIEVSAGLGSGAYVAAMLYRPMDETAKRMPGRAVGIKWLGLDQSARTLQVGLALPAKVKPATTLSIPVKLGGLAAGEEARITVAAVDVGILNLTRFKEPAPEGWFHAQRKLGVEIRDFYSRLIDGMRAQRGRLRSGGDAGGGMAMNGSPPVEALLALYSGIVKVGADGTAKVDFQLPEFNGSVRVMAVAWSNDKLGHGVGEVIVRDPVALTVSAPRFLTLGDEARLEIAAHNIEGPAGAFTLSADQVPAPGTAGAVTRAFERKVDIKPNERRREAFTLKPADVGTFQLDVRVAGPAGIDVRRRLTFDVKPPAGDIRRTTVSQLSAKGGRLSLSPDLAQDMIPGRTRISVSVGPTAALDVPGLLTQLDRYPYGCAEQTTSRALPLLYANQLAMQSGLPKDADLRDRIQKAIDRVLEMQEASGAFGVWGPRNGDLWLTSYVTDFLTRAKESGFTVKPLAFTQALDRLQNYVSYAQDFQRGGEARAYALYVLARNGRAPIGELRYWADSRLDRFATPLAKAQLGAALAMLGDKERAEKVFRSALGSLAALDDKEFRLDYGSMLRDGAALVTLAAETRTAREEAPKLISVLAKAFSGRSYTSTQEQAWMLLAANALAEQGRDTTLTVGNAPHKGSLNRVLTVAELKDGVLTIRNDGDAAVDAVVSVIGAALTPEPPVSKGFTIERSAYTLDGKKVELASLSGGTGKLRQSDRLVMVLKIEAAEAGGRVLLVDRLPSGLEIENPRIVDSGDVKSLDWLKPTLRPEHVEFRDDRFVAAFDLFGNGGRGGRGNRQSDDDDADGNNGGAKGAQTTATVAYIVRAVSPGSFVHPAATVEDMYRPDRLARTAAGRLEITAKD